LTSTSRSSNGFSQLPNLLLPELIVILRLLLCQMGTTVRKVLQYYLVPYSQYSLIDTLDGKPSEISEEA
jgi:hypothetical protein